MICGGMAYLHILTRVLTVHEREHKKTFLVSRGPENQAYHRMQEETDGGREAISTNIGAPFVEATQHSTARKRKEDLLIVH